MENIDQNPVFSGTEKFFDAIIQNGLTKKLDPVLGIAGKTETLMRESWAGFSEEERANYTFAIARHGVEFLNIPHPTNDLGSMRLYLNAFDGVIEKYVQTMIPPLEAMWKRTDIPQATRQEILGMLDEVVELPFREKISFFCYRDAPGIRCAAL